MRKILITGITGFLGSHVAKICLERGYQIRGAVKDLSYSDELIYLNQLQKKTRKNIELIEANLSNYNSWDNAIKGCTDILHLATPLLDLKKSNEGVKFEILTGIQGILDFSKKYKIQKIVVTGSAQCAGIYRNLKKNIFTDSDFATLTSSENGYLEGKIMMENYLYNYYKDLSEKSKIDITIIHPANLYGPALSRNSAQRLNTISKMLLQKPAYFRLCMPLCDVRDVSLAHVNALTNLNNKDFNRYLISSGNLWLNEIPEIINAHFYKYGYECRKMPFSQMMLKIGAMTNPETRKALQNENREFFIKSDNAKRDLNLNFIDPKKTIIDSVYSLIEHEILPNKINRK